MGDYCECGNAATFKCRCGRTTCDWHKASFPVVDAVKLPSPRAGYEVVLADASRLAPLIARHLTTPPADPHMGAPLQHIVGRLLCRPCCEADMSDAAESVADVFRQHSDGSQAAAARVLIDLQLWAPNGWHLRPEPFFGQSVVARLGEVPHWAHPNPLDTAVHLHAATAAGRLTIPIGHTVLVRRLLTAGGLPSNRSAR